MLLGVCLGNLTNLRQNKDSISIQTEQRKSVTEMHEAWAPTTMKESSFFRCSGVVSGSDATSKHLCQAAFVKTRICTLRVRLQQVVMHSASQEDEFVIWLHTSTDDQALGRSNINHQSERAPHSFMRCLSACASLASCTGAAKLFIGQRPICSGLGRQSGWRS